MHVVDIVAASGQERLAILNVPGSTVVVCVEGRSGTWLGDSTVQAMSALTAAAWYWNMDGFAGVPFRKVVCLGRKRLLILDGKLRGHPPPEKIKFDYILLSHKADVNISRLHEYFTYDLLIFDASVPPFRLREWKNACKELTLRCFSVPDEGAFIVNL